MSDVTKADSVNFYLCDLKQDDWMLDVIQHGLENRTKGEKF